MPVEAPLSRLKEEAIACDFGSFAAIVAGNASPVGVSIFRPAKPPSTAVDEPEVDDEGVDGEGGKGDSARGLLSSEGVKYSLREDEGVRKPLPALLEELEPDTEREMGCEWT